MRFRSFALLALAVTACLPVTAAQSQSRRAPTPAEAANLGQVIERSPLPQAELSEFLRFSNAINSLAPQRPGQTDVYVVVAGLDADPVFGREAAQTASLLSRRYNAASRTLTLAAGPGAGEGDASKAVANGSPRNLGIALAAVSAKMDPAEDVLVVYITAHGHFATGLAYLDGNRGRGNIGPQRLAAMLNNLPARNRLVMLSACYAGVFVPVLATPTTVVATAASSERTSFGCAPGNDWTYFGDALINNALRKQTGFIGAFEEARSLISTWETADRLTPSMPQISVGADTGWLARIDASVPADLGPLEGRPAYSPQPASRPTTR
jgi:Peptidase C13 family